VSQESFSGRLMQLVDSDFILGMKVETESEGLPWQEISRLRVISSKFSIPFLVKIGGVEAITDMHASVTLGVDELIAPMVESKFAASKFLDASSSHASGVDGKRLLIESAQGIANLTEILEFSHSKISGVNFGRSDYSASLELDTGEPVRPDSEIVSRNISSAIQEVRSLGLEVTMGGKITPDSIPLIRDSFSHLPDRLETRRFVFSAEMAFLDESLVRKLLELELEMLSAFVAQNNSSALRTSVYVGELRARLNPKKQEAPII